MKKFVFVLVFAFFCISAYAPQKIKARGVVLEAGTNSPIIGASVFQSDSPSNGVVSGLNGSFSLSIPAGKTIDVFCVGYWPSYGNIPSNNMTIYLTAGKSVPDGVAEE